MLLPLELHVIQHLSPLALGCLASTCKSLRSLLTSQLLDREWWHRAVVDKLGSRHPVLQAQSAPPSREALRSAIEQYSRASTNMQAGRYSESEPCCLVSDPSCTVLLSVSRRTTA